MSLLAPTADAFRRAEPRADSCAPAVPHDVARYAPEQSAVRTIEIFPDVRAIEAEWRALQARGHGSIYQTFDWCRLWLECFQGPNDQPAIAVARISGQAIMLLPLYTRQVGAGMRRIEMIGAPHANVYLPLVSRSGPHVEAIEQWAANGALLDDLSRALCEADAGDYLTLGCMAETFGGVRNPLVSPEYKRCYDAVFGIALREDFDAFARERRGKAYMKKLRSKTRALEAYGPVELQRVDEPEDVSAALETFFAQKKERFDRLKLFNRFDDAQDRAFLRALADHHTQHASGTLEVYQLMVGDTVGGVFALGTYQGNASGAVNSITSKAEIVARSPGDIMVHALMKRLSAEGLGFFDLGFGDHRYKQAWTDTIALYSVDRVLTGRGNALALASRASAVLRSALLHNPTVARAARQVRFFIARLRS